MLRKLFGLGKNTGRKKDPVAEQLGIDPEMCYCPSCGDEYRADITTCAGCNIALISGTEKLSQAKEKTEAFFSRSMEIGPEEPRVAIKGGKLRDLKPYQLLLAKERIPALLTGQEGDCRKG
ncbi:hypothetical protein SAMN02745220_03467 [Desulfopila aestuarii DSM 18488]|uniref:Uncharacterized protein n=1 Tax=Desulfopila aestuarii DSM 18488 TaxID=1121416 RepID=A0A1M7YCZ4_9BACT|nr:hypothetical protein [Desulfopila aestuarii]SHO50461.1 hypothetical protein SAMN02745220_03467 [Desulfopila aestuarii DSM 18488]